MKNLTCVPKNTDTFKAIEETEVILPHEPEGDLATPLMAELFMAMMAEVLSAVVTAKKCYELSMGKHSET